MRPNSRCVSTTKKIYARCSVPCACLPAPFRGTGYTGTPRTPHSEVFPQCAHSVAVGWTGCSHADVMGWHGSRGLACSRGLSRRWPASSCSSLRESLGAGRARSRELQHGPELVLRDVVREEVASKTTLQCVPMGEGHGVCENERVRV